MEFLHRSRKLALREAKVRQASEVALKKSDVLLREQAEALSEGAPPKGRVSGDAGTRAAQSARGPRALRWRSRPARETPTTWNGAEIRSSGISSSLLA